MSTNTSTQLTTTRPDTALLPAPDAWSTMSQMAKVMAGSGLMPNGVKTEAAVLTIMLKGRELGLPAMTAINGISIISGKPSVNADLMAAIIYRDHGDDALQWIDANNECATLSYKRRGWKDRREHSFTLADAKLASLTTKDTWKSYPGAMLRARCLSAVARMAFPDSIGGMYTTEEMEDMQAQDGTAPTVVDVTPSGRTVNTATGEVIESTALPERGAISAYDTLTQRLKSAGGPEVLAAVWTAVNAAKKSGDISPDQHHQLAALKDQIKSDLANVQPYIDAQPSPAVVASYDELERRVSLVSTEDGAHEVRQDALTARDAGPHAGGITPEQYATIDKYIDERLTIALPF